MKIYKFRDTQLRFNSDNIFRQFDRHDLINRRKAGMFLARQIRKNINSRSKSSSDGFPSRVTGNLFKSIGLKTTIHREVLVGAKRGKGSHAHLLEYGHEPNVSKSKRPFLQKTFKAHKNKLINIMSGSWE